MFNAAPNTVFLTSAQPLNRARYAADMPKLLLNLRNVPDDESADVRAFLDEHSIDWYETKPSIFGVSAGGIWLRDPDQYDRARQLMTDYQAARLTRVRAEHAQALRDGSAPTVLGELKSSPRKAFMVIAALALAAAVAAWPLLLMR